MSAEKKETKLMRKVSFTERYAILRLPRSWFDGKHYVLVTKTDDKIVIKPVK